MWKKLLVSMLALACTFSVVYGIYNQLFAISSSNVITGRVGDLQQGDRVLLDSTPTSWLLTKNITDVKGNAEAQVPNDRTTPYQAWAAFASTSLGNEPLTTNLDAFISNGSSYTASDIIDGTMKNLNTQLAANARDMSFVTDRINFNALNNCSLLAAAASESGKRAYIGFAYEMNGSEGGTLAMNADELAFGSTYWTAGANVPGPTQCQFILDRWGVYGSTGQRENATSLTTLYAIRPLLNLTFKDVVFSMEPTSTAGYVSVSKPVRANKIYQSDGNGMKVRVHNANMDMQFLNIEKEGKSIQQIVKGKTVDLIADAPQGFDNEGVWTVSVLLYDNSGNLLYYRPLEKAKGKGVYTLDLSGLDVGAYKVALVNESYDTTNLSPADSSSITTALPLEIVADVSLSVTPTPQNQSTFEYSKNVSDGDQIASISSSGGAKPITYTLSKDSSVSGHDKDYEKFRVDTSGNTPLIRVDHVDGLEAGTYYFTVSALDKNGDALNADGNPKATTKVSITVEKTMPSISFVDPAIRNVPYVSGYSFTENITHTNTDMNPAISYQANKNIVQAVKDNNSEHARITLNTSNATGSVDIVVTLAATKNFKSATAKKTLNVYNGIQNLRLDYAKTPITASDTLQPNYTIGKLRFDGGIANFTYEICDDPSDPSANVDGSKFQVDSTLTSSRYMDVETTQPLQAQTYYVTFKVTDSYVNSTYFKAQIVVAAGEVTGFEFYEDATMQTIKTNQTLKVPYGTKNTQLYAGGGSGTGAISYRLKDGEKQDVIQIQNASLGTYTILKTGKVLVEAEKESDANYAKKVIEMELEIVAQSQSIAFTSNVPAKKKFVLDDTIDITAQLTRPDGSTGALRYSASPADVCIVENNNSPILKIKGKGSCTVYVENSDVNYEAATQTKTITLYEGISGNFVQIVDPLHQGDAFAKAGSTTPIAKVSSLVGGDGTFTFTALKAYKNNMDVSHIFQMDASGNITPKQDISYGSYEMHITIEDGNKEATTIHGILNVDFEGNANFQLTRDGKVEASIESDYVSAQNPKITVDTIGKKGTNPVQFKLLAQKDASQSIEAISLDEQTGILSVHRAMTASDSYQIYAIVEEDEAGGFARQETAHVDIIIKPSPQKIQFDANVPMSVKYDAGKTFPINASLDRTDGDITYSSATTSICSVDDPSLPVATVIGKGYCIIRAENKDENYIQESRAVSILISDGMSAVFQQTIQPLRQGDAALQPSSGTSIAKIYSLAGNQGMVSYSISVKKGIVDVSHLFDIDTNGEVFVKDVVPYGTYDVAVTLRDQTGVDGEVVITGQILVGLEENAAFAITYKGSNVTTISESYTTALKGMAVNVRGQKGSGKVYYTKTQDSNTNAIEIQADGTLLIHGVMQPQDVFKVYAYVEEDLINGFARQETAPVSITITDAEMGTLSWQVDGVDAAELHDVYAPSKAFQLGIDGAPAGSTIRYYLQADGDGKMNGIPVDDVVSIDEQTGEVTVLHASLNEQIGLVKILAEVSCSGYTTSTMDPLDVYIDKAEQAGFKFSQSTYIMPNGTGSFSPTFVGGALHEDGSSYNQKLSCSDPYDVRVDPQNPDTFLYHVTDVEGATITIKARNLGNRDYNAKEASAILKIMKAGESLFDVEVSPSKVISYGDAVTLLPDVAESASVSYTYTSEEPALLQQDATDANVFHGIQVGTASIKVIKHELGKADAEAIVTIRVKPKDVVVELQGSYQIKTGEAIPNFIVAPYPAGTILAGDILPEPSITTTAKDSLTVGSYPITVTYAKDVISDNYHFIQTPMDLIITQDEAEEDWFQSYAKSDTTKAQLQANTWLNEPVILESLHPVYNTISKNGKNNWGQTLEVSQEGEYEVPIYFQSTATNALSAPIQTTVRIDYTGPEITSIKAQNTNTSAFARMMNVLTFQAFYKPGVEITIQAEDIPVQGASSSSGVKEVSYRIDSLKNGQVDQNIKLEPGGSTSDHVTITLSKVGEYRVCATAIDQVGNKGSEACKDIQVKKIDVLVDEDELPDFNDSDEDGCPDLNIKWRNPQKLEEWIIRNGDRDYDGLPDLNIDSNGDGIADLNIDSDMDGNPDINLVDMTKKDSNGKQILWEPTQCVTSQQETYCTGIKAEAMINVDIDGDGIPDLNIDTDGDMVADFNISFDNKKPYLNIGKVPSVWKPNKDAKAERFHYDTMDTLLPVLNMGIIDGRYPSINIDIDGDGIADLNIDIDHDGKPDLNIDGNGDGKADVNIDYDGDGRADDSIMRIDTWKPELLVEDSLPYMTMKLTYKGIEQLEDQGIVVIDSDKGFLPNHALKIKDVTSQRQEELGNVLQEQGQKGAITVIYEVLLYQDDHIVQPNGRIQVKVPIEDGIEKPRLMMQQKDESFLFVDAEIIEGYYVFETDYLGVLIILEEEEKTQENPNEDKNGSNTSVKGSYTSEGGTVNKSQPAGGIGGAYTGDSSSIQEYCLWILLSSFAIICFYRKWNPKQLNKKR